jgi:hypothetical protein
MKCIPPESVNPFGVIVCEEEMMPLDIENDGLRDVESLSVYTEHLIFLNGFISG